MAPSLVLFRNITSGNTSSTLGWANFSYRKSHPSMNKFYTRALKPAEGDWGNRDYEKKPDEEKPRDERDQYSAHWIFRSMGLVTLRAPRQGYTFFLRICNNSYYTKPSNVTTTVFFASLKSTSTPPYPLYFGGRRPIFLNAKPVVVRRSGNYN